MYVSVLLGATVLFVSTLLAAETPGVSSEFLRAIASHVHPAYLTTESCATLLDEYMSYKDPVDRNEEEWPPIELPEAMKGDFLMDNTIPLETFFVDDSNKGKGTHYKHTKQNIEHSISHIKQLLDKPPMQRQGLRTSDRWLLDALSQFKDRLNGAHVGIFGSNSPFYEALALAMGANHVTTIEYNRLTYDHDQITTTTPANLELPPQGFDVLLSISSFDHDGLGRYGDALAANGDFRAMAIARCLLSDTGLLFLTVPIGPDTIVYNLHRRYGIRRLPNLLAGYKIVNTFGWDEEKLHLSADYRRSYEPVFVLQPGSTTGEDRPDKLEL